MHERIASLLELSAAVKTTFALHRITNCVAFEHQRIHRLLYFTKEKVVVSLQNVHSLEYFVAINVILDVVIHLKTSLEDCAFRAARKRDFQNLAVVTVFQVFCERILVRRDVFVASI